MVVSAALVYHKSMNNSERCCSHSNVCCGFTYLLASRVCYVCYQRKASEFRTENQK